MFWIKVFSLQFTAWSCRSSFPSDQNHQHRISCKWWTIQIFCEKWTMQIFCEKWPVQIFCEKWTLQIFCEKIVQASLLYVTQAFISHDYLLSFNVTNQCKHERFNGIARGVSAESSSSSHRPLKETRARSKRWCSRLRVVSCAQIWNHILFHIWKKKMATIQVFTSNLKKTRVQF